MFKCGKCGGSLIMQSDGKKVRCEKCGTEYTTGSLQKLYRERSEKKTQSGNGAFRT